MIDDCDAEIERLREEARWQSFRVADKDCLIENLRARNAELVAALQQIEQIKPLKPVGAWGDPYVELVVSVVGIARAALAKAEHDPRDDFSPQNDPFAKAEGK